MSEQHYSPKVRDAFNGRGVDPSKLTPQQRLRDVCAWHLGHPGWEETFLKWARECGYTITPIPKG